MMFLDPIIQEKALILLELISGLFKGGDTWFRSSWTCRRSLGLALLALPHKFEVQTLSVSDGTSFFPNGCLTFLSVGSGDNSRHKWGIAPQCHPAL